MDVQYSLYVSLKPFDVPYKPIAVRDSLEALVIKVAGAEVDESRIGTDEHGGGWVELDVSFESIDDAHIMRQKIEGEIASRGYITFRSTLSITNNDKEEE